MWRRVFSLPLRYCRYRGFGAAPLWATFDVTWNCNCRCEYCNYWREDHIDLPFPAVETVIRNLRRIGLWYLGLSGGEPLLRRDIVDIVRCAKAAGMLVGLNTNGTIRKDGVYRALMESGLDSLCFSLDGATAATHEHFRKNCPFPSVLRSIEAAVDLRNRHRYRTRITTNTVVHRGNVHELEAVCALRAQLGADRNNFQPVVTGHIQDAQQRARIGFSAEDQALLEKVRAVLRSLPRGNISGYVDLIADYYGDGRATRRLECYAGRAFAYVSPEGILYPCSVLREPLADLTREDAPDRLRDREARQILRKAGAQKCPGCSLICYMERNVLLNRALSPRVWFEALGRRYLPPPRSRRHSR